MVYFSSSLIQLYFMKTVFFSLLALCAGFTVSGQRMVPGTAKAAPSAARVHTISKQVTTGTLPWGKTTADTMTLYNNYDSLLFQSSALYGYGVARPVDSGYVFGMNAYDDNSFAEYFFAPYQPDTTIKIIGVYSAWGGTVAANSTNTLTFKVWSIDTTLYQLNSKSYITGTPANVIGSSQAVRFTSLNLTPGTATITYFTPPIANIQGDFFLGYTVAYSFTASSGDTIGLRSTPDGAGIGSGYYQTDGQGDTIYFSQNAVYTSSGKWLDGYVDLGKNVNLSLVPLYSMGYAASVKGVTQNNLTEFGLSPNPAIKSTSLHISLQQNADVTVQVVNAAGRTMATIQQPGLAAGAHIINILTSTLPAGNYVCVARTNTGAIIASQLTVLK
jgi:hypothetical protein